MILSLFTDAKDLTAWRIWGVNDRNVRERHSLRSHRICADGTEKLAGTIAAPREGT